MLETRHDLHSHFPEDGEILSRLKVENAQFRTLAERYDGLDKEIHRIEVETEGRLGRAAGRAQEASARAAGRSRRAGRRRALNSRRAPLRRALACIPLPALSLPARSEPERMEMARTPQEEANAQLVRDLFDKVLIPMGQDARRYIHRAGLSPAQLAGRAGARGAEALARFRARREPAGGRRKSTASSPRTIMSSPTSMSSAGPGDPGFAVCDIFRIADGRIVEHWDVLQEISASPVNPNSSVRERGLEAGPAKTLSFPA